MHVKLTVIDNGVSGSVSISFYRLVAASIVSGSVWCVCILTKLSVLMVINLVYII